MNYSILIPAHNEAENIVDLLMEIERVMTPISSAWEVVVVDDGSRDQTWDRLENTQALLPQLRAIRLKECSGQSAALQAGIAELRGEVTITLDGDGQNDPKDIPKLLAFLDSFDVVSGCRVNRQDSWSKRYISKWANRIRSFLLSDGVSDTGCSLKAYKTQYLKRLRLFKGMHRFLPALLIIEGCKVCQVPVSHRPRKHGSSKYSFFNRGISTVTDLLAVMWMKRRHRHALIEKRLP